MGLVRWDALFADLEAGVEAEAEAEQRGEIADRIRAEYGRLRLVDRLGPLLPPGGGRLRVSVLGQEVLNGRLRALGSDWLLLDHDGGSSPGELLVPFAAVQWVQGLGRASAEPGSEGTVGSRLTFRVALRRVVRDRSLVKAGLTGGDALTGRLARVGADHVEIHATDDADGPVRAGQAIPIAALAVIQRR